MDPPSNVAYPRLFFEVKTHKEGWPLRPLVNKRTHPTYHLEKVLAKLLSGLLPPPPWVTSSSIEAKTSIFSVLGNSSCNEYSFYKLDVVALYPSVPQFEAVMLANSLLIKECFTAQQILEIRDALLFITENDYFRFNGRIYLQKQGVPIGSPLSAVLAELLMRHVEQRVFNFPLTIAYPLLYLRYVDDILVAWQETEEDFLAFKTALTKVYSTISFTWEKENEGAIAFLDLNISKSQGTLSYSVFHKFNCLPPLIPATAFQPQHYVNAAIAPLIRRAFLLSSSQTAVDIELNAIRSAVNAAGYTNAKYRYLLNKVKKSLFPPTTLHVPNECTVVLPTLPFCGRVTIRICRVFRQHTLFLPVSPRPNLRRLLCNDRDATSVLERSGVYSIPLENTASGIRTHYVGATTRMLACRISEHQLSIRAGKADTELARMVLQHPYTPLWDQVMMLRHCNNRSVVFIWEAFLTAALNPCNTPTLDLPVMWVNLYNRLKQHL
ncbi:uncharacterized protein [Centruroides vittatus]|uniref:uncharacterized protein n=1 Tax=Centruroides vittatus TaxID=120091 RepID=UPI0035104ED6